MKIYKIVHLRTGLFYHPSQHVWLSDGEKKWGKYVKTNLSKKGKMYTTKVSPTWYKYYYDEKGGYHNTGNEDFVVKEYNLT